MKGGVYRMLTLKRHLFFFVSITTNHLSSKVCGVKGSIIPLNRYVCVFLPLFLKAHRFSFLVCPVWWFIHLLHLQILIVQTLCCIIVSPRWSNRITWVTTPLHLGANALSPKWNNKRRQTKVSIRPRACFSPSYNKVKSQTCFVWLLTLL